MHRSTSTSLRRTLACVLVAVGLLAAAACGSDDDDESGAPGTTAPESTGDATDPLAPQPLAERTEVSIAISNRAVSFLPILLADELGAFDEENLDVKIEFLPAADAPLLVSQGTVDASASSVSAAVLNLISSEADLRVVFPYEPEFADESESGVWVSKDVIGDDGVQADDLRGAKIASATGAGSNAAAYLWYELFKDEGLPADELTTEVMGIPDGAIAVTQGAIDGAIVIPPFTEQVRASGCCEFVGGNPAFPNAWILFGDRLLNEDRDAGTAMLRAIARTMTGYLSGDFLEDPAKVETIAALLEQPVDTVEASSAVVWDLTTADPQTALDVVHEFWLERGDILSYTEPLGVEDVFDLGFYDELVPEG